MDEVKVEVVTKAFPSPKGDHDLVNEVVREGHQNLESTPSRHLEDQILDRKDDQNRDLVENQFLGHVGVDLRTEKPEKDQEHVPKIERNVAIARIKSGRTHDRDTGNRKDDPDQNMIPWRKSAKTTKSPVILAKINRKIKSAKLKNSTMKNEENVLRVKRVK